MRGRMDLNILEYAENELQVKLNFSQKDLLQILQKDSDYIQYVNKKSHTMIIVLDIFSKWKEKKLLAT
jgi:hypothetical protein